MISVLLLVVAFPALFVAFQHLQYQRWMSDVEARGGMVGITPGDDNWLRDLVGDRWMRGYDEVWLVELVEATDDDLRRVTQTENLSRTDYLILRNPRLSHAGWEMVGELETLGHLQIRGDASLLQNRELLPRLKNLKTLVIGDVSLSGIGEIENLALLPRLDQPVFVDVPLSKSQIESLSRHTQFTGFGIVGTSLNREDVASLQHLADLRSLVLEDTNLSDEAVPDLAAFKQLEYLNLSENSISSDALHSLATLKKLKTLELKEMTPAGGDFDPRHLRSALPNCEIHVEPSP